MASLVATLELKTEKANAHSDGIYSVDFSPDGSKIVSGSSDETIKVWDSGAFWAKITYLCPELTPPAFTRSYTRAEDREGQRPQWLRDERRF